MTKQLNGNQSEKHDNCGNEENIPSSRRGPETVMSLCICAPVSRTETHCYAESTCFLKVMMSSQGAVSGAYPLAVYHLIHVAPFAIHWPEIPSIRLTLTEEAWVSPSSLWSPSRQGPKRLTAAAQINSTSPKARKTDAQTLAKLLKCDAVCVTSYSLTKIAGGKITWHLVSGRVTIALDVAFELAFILLCLWFFFKFSVFELLFRALLFVFYFVENASF